MFWLVLFCVILCVVVAVLGLKLVLMRKSAREIREQLAEKLECDTNTLISVSTGDREIRKLANDLNFQLKELKQQRRRFVQGDTELKSAVTNISHDLRTPLTAISGYLELLDKAEKSEDVKRYLEVIKNRTEVMKGLTEELFRYSVITSPEYDTHTELVAVNAVLEESILGFYAALTKRNITPKICMTEQKVMRNVNSAALGRVFSNLLNNAIKYSDGDLVITLSEHGEITFSNQASGLSEVEAGRLFERFYTVENARKSTGLGLSIAKILIEQMNGSITASYENDRLSICVRLPK